MKQFSSLEIISTATVLLAVVVDLSRVFHAVDSATLQVAHRCTPAPDGTLAVPAVLPTQPRFSGQRRGLSCRPGTFAKHPGLEHW